MEKTSLHPSAGSAARFAVGVLGMICHADHLLAPATSAIIVDRRSSGKLTLFLSQVLMDLVGRS